MTRPPDGDPVGKAIVARREGGHLPGEAGPVDPDQHLRKRLLDNEGEFGPRVGHRDGVAVVIAAEAVLFPPDTLYFEDRADRRAPVRQREPSLDQPLGFDRGDIEPGEGYGLRTSQRIDPWVICALYPWAMTSRSKRTRGSRPAKNPPDQMQEAEKDRRNPDGRC
jgi:hypothetical protein